MSVLALRIEHRMLASDIAGMDNPLCAGVVDARDRFLPIFADLLD